MRFRRLGTPEQEAARRAQQRRDRARMVQRQEEERTERDARQEEERLERDARQREVLRRFVDECKASYAPGKDVVRHFRDEFVASFEPCSEARKSRVAGAFDCIAGVWAHWPVERLGETQLDMVATAVLHSGLHALVDPAWG